MAKRVFRVFSLIMLGYFLTAYFVKPFVTLDRGASKSVHSAKYQIDILKAAQANVQNEGFLILTIANHGILQLTLNFLQSLHNQGIRKYLVACFDTQICEKLEEFGYGAHAGLIPSEWLGVNISREFVVFNTPEYEKLIKRKTTVVREFLSANFTVFLNDVDVVWLSPDVPAYMSNLTKIYELAAMDDNESGFNSGFYIVRPTKTMLELFKRTITLDGVSDQLDINAAAAQMGLGGNVIHRLDQLLFANGRNFFTLRKNEEVQVKPMVVHANWMVGEAKIEALKKKNFWFI